MVGWLDGWMLSWMDGRLVGCVGGLIDLNGRQVRSFDSGMVVGWMVGRLEHLNSWIGTQFI